MVKEIEALKAETEQQMLYTKAKLDVLDNLLARYYAKYPEVVEEETVEEENLAADEELAVLD